MLPNLSGDTEFPRPVTLFVEMKDDYRDKVVREVLNARGDSSRKARDAFDSAVNSTLTAQDVPRFPRQPARAAPGMLLEPVLRAVCHSDALACATLRVWVESHKSLQDMVSARLAEIGVAAEYPDFSNNRLRGYLLGDELERETDALIELHDGLDRDDVSLMICYVSGKIPYAGENEPDGEDEPVDNRILSGTIEYLESLPLAAPEWDRTIPAFARKVAEIVSAKEEERSRAAKLDAALADIRSDFPIELAYLESDTASWSASKISAGENIAKALGICEELRSALAEYRTVRESPPAVTRSENRERRNRIDGLEDRILRLLESISGVMSGEPTPDDDPPKLSRHTKDRPEDDSVIPDKYAEASEGKTGALPQSLEVSQVFESEKLPHEDDSLKSERDKLSRENESLRTETCNLEAENETLRSENQKLERENQSLRLDKKDLRRKMRAELNKSRDEVTRLRLTYDEERNMPRPTLENVSLRVESVDDAVTYASEMFPDRLLFRTNSKSVVRENLFEKPKDVWSALEWLATTYHNAKMGEASVPDFDLSIREACGWWYKSDQHETTRNKYRDWYTTRVNGDRRWLLEHIGTGSSKDARHTIRVAFDWDKDEKVVVVGYIGQHQRTDAT